MQIYCTILLNLLEKTVKSYEIRTRTTETLRFIFHPLQLILVFGILPLVDMSTSSGAQSLASLDIDESVHSNPLSNLVKLIRFVMPSESCLLQSLFRWFNDTANPQPFTLLSLSLSIPITCSKDGYEFIIPRNIALVSGTLKALLTSRGQWRERAGPIPTINLETISGPVLEKVIEYFFYKVRYNNTPPPVPAFPLELDSLVPLLVAANYLDT